MEEWRLLDDYPGYEVSDLGRVRGQLIHEDDYHMIAIRTNTMGLPFVGLSVRGRQHNRALAPLVAEAFLGPPLPPATTPINMDGDRFNCAADNLAWRPRWYAIRYHRQFQEDYVYRIHNPIRNTKTGREFEGSLEAAAFYGILEQDVSRCVLGIIPSAPVLWESFEVV